jgi:hypothetical protein
MGIYLINLIVIPSSLYEKIMNNTITTVIGLGIFNLGALLALLQLNYNKFNSSILLRNLLKSPILISLTVFPFITAIFNFFFLNEKNHYDFLPTTIIIVSILSSIFLIAHYNNMSEINAMLIKLFRKTNEIDFDTYKDNIVYRVESNIDTILSLSLQVIKKEDIANAHSFFNNFYFWINKNIRFINYDIFNPQEKMLNKFHHFFEAIINTIMKSKSDTLHKYFLTSIERLVLSKANSENFKLYEIIYEALFKYLLLCLDEKDEYLAKDIYHAIYNNASSILLNMPTITLKKDSPRVHDINLKNFEDIFIKPLDKFIKKAIEKKCISRVQS